MFARELLTDLAEVVGTCVDDRAYRRLSDGVALLNNKGLVNALVGEMAICVCGNFITLPPEVETVLAINVNGSGSLLRNQWYQFHVNGSGDQGGTPPRFADILGDQFPTFRDPDRPVNLVAVIENASDANKRLRVYGFDEAGNRIYTPGPDGNLVDGFLVPLMTTSNASNGDAAPIVKIERIQKEVTSGFVDLYAVDPDTNAVISALGRYRPNETAPQYTRIRVPHREAVRVKYRARDFNITGPDDWINCSNRLALVNAVRAAKALFDGQTDLAQTYEAIATRLIKDEMRSQVPGGISPPQVIVDGIDGQNSSLFYGQGRVIW